MYIFSLFLSLCSQLYAPFHPIKDRANERRNPEGGSKPPLREPVSEVSRHLAAGSRTTTLCPSSACQRYLAAKLCINRPTTTNNNNHHLNKSSFLDKDNKIVPRKPAVRSSSFSSLLLLSSSTSSSLSYVKIDSLASLASASSTTNSGAGLSNSSGVGCGVDEQACHGVYLILHDKLIQES